jgi:hypothetical protein
LKIKTALFVSGFLGNDGKVEREGRIIDAIQPAFSEIGWKIVPPKYHGGQPTNKALEEYRDILAEEIAAIKPDALIGHSMGTLLIRGLPEEFDGPIVLIEGPNWGAPWWKLLLSKYPIWNKSIRGMVRKGFPRIKTSKYILRLRDIPIKSAPVLEIHGTLANSELGRDVFERIPYVRNFENFPDIKHVTLATDKKVIEVVLKFIQKHAK